MSEHTGYSSSFIRPAEILRMRRKRARSNAGVFSSPSGPDSAGSPTQGDSSPVCIRPFSHGPLFNIQNRSGGGVKRRNPFANVENTFSPKKRLVIYNDDGNCEAADVNKTRKPSEKVGNDGEDKSTKTECQGALPFSGRLAAAEKQERHDTSSKVRYKTCLNWNVVIYASGAISLMLVRLLNSALHG